MKYLTSKEVSEIEYAYRKESTPGPCIMRIHLVRYSTSARSGKNPKIFTCCKIHLSNANFFKSQKYHYARTRCTPKPQKCHK